MLCVELDVGTVKSFLLSGESLVGKLWPCLPSFVLTCELEILGAGDNN